MINVIDLLSDNIHLVDMNQRRDIQNLEDVKLLVDTFYSKVREDDMLKDIFNNVIQERWPEHQAKMYRFWQTVVLEEYTYSGAPFPPHTKLLVEQEHFDHWIKLFCNTVDELFAGEKAEHAKWQGRRMAEIFAFKIQYLRTNNLTPLV